MEDHVSRVPGRAFGKESPKPVLQGKGWENRGSSFADRGGVERQARSGYKTLHDMPVPTTTPRAAPGSGAPRVLHFRRLFSLRSESFLYDQIRELDRQGVPNQVACLARLRDRERPFPTLSLLRVPERARMGGRVAQTVGSGFGWTEADRFLWSLCRWRLRRALRGREPRLVHAHFGPDGCLIAPLAAQLQVPLLVSFYGYDVSRLLAHSRKSWERRYRTLFRQATFLLAISNHVRRTLLALGAPPQKIVLQPLGCDLERFQAPPPSTRFDGHTVRFLHVGRLTAKKDPVRLVAAFAKACRELQGQRRLELTIAGDGELWQATLQEVAREGLEDRVRLLGSVPHTQVRELLADAHVYAQHCRTADNNDQEGLGVTFIEASAAGLPIVTTDHSGIADTVLPEESALLSPEGDVDAMAVNLARMARSPEQWDAFGLRGQEHARASFSLEAVTRRLRELYARALDSGSEDSPRSERRRLVSA